MARVQGQLFIARQGMLIGIMQYIHPSLGYHHRERGLFSSAQLSTQGVSVRSPLKQKESSCCQCSGTWKHTGELSETTGGKGQSFPPLLNLFLTWKEIHQKRSLSSACTILSAPH